MTRSIVPKLLVYAAFVALSFGCSATQITALQQSAGTVKSRDAIVAHVAAINDQAFTTSTVEASASESGHMIATQGEKEPACIAALAILGHDCSDSFFYTFTCKCNSLYCECKQEYVA